LGARLLFWPIYVLLLVGVTLAGTEAIASFLVPPYPARDIRPIAVGPSADSYNDWGLRDRPRSITRPPDVHFRSLLVGDSFLENGLVRVPLSAAVERQWSDAGHTGMEAINFGVSATGPRQYYYRIKDVGLALKPDAIVLAVYVGNDFVSLPFGGWMPSLIQERPLPSLLGAVAPRATWLAVNRLGLSEFGRSNSGIDGEFAQLNEWLELPAAERLDRLVRHMKQHYFPSLGGDTIREILSRGGDRFWTAFAKRPDDREHLAGWMLRGMIDWEINPWITPRDAAEADRLEGAKMIDETLSWLVATHRLAKENGVPLVAALIPVGTVDPSYVEFWRPWPKYFGASLGADARHKHLAVALRQTGVPFIDLRDDLNGVPGTYRLTDGHWTELGTRLVANRVSRELLKMQKD
jgi:hypothetical protein